MRNLLQIFSTYASITCIHTYAYTNKRSPSLSRFQAVKIHMHIHIHAHITIGLPKFCILFFSPFYCHFLQHISDLMTIVLLLLLMAGAKFLCVCVFYSFWSPYKQKRLMLKVEARHSTCTRISKNKTNYNITCDVTLLASMIAECMYVCMYTAGTRFITTLLAVQCFVYLVNATCSLTCSLSLFLLYIYINMPFTYMDLSY